jgi:hypothetical protein
MTCVRERWDNGQWDEAHWDGQICVPADAGAVVVSGKAATFVRARGLGAAPGAVTLSGRPAGLTIARRLVAARGTVTLTGYQVLFSTRKLMVVPLAGTVTVTGYAVNLVKRTPAVLTADKGAVTLSGKAARLAAARRLAASPGAILLTGYAAGLTTTSAQRILASPGAILLTGYAAELSIAARVMPAAPATVLVDSVGATLARTYVLAAEPSPIALAGVPVTLFAGRLLPPPGEIRMGRRGYIPNRW